ncbi:MAG: SRPBCC domain-containing protein [Melioribacteraceae bacterium]|nr:SRPBCC domain-containing protein [Melioribacteraceae bacterium]MCF8263997.1 SRPBCC domain-containing protein [Melioribacteraceae bacterium]
MDEFELTEIFNISPELLYIAWLDEDQHSEMTGGAAEISDEIGAEFAAWDGYITGKNLELKFGKKILQSWRTSEFPQEAEDSLLEIIFERDKDGTKLTLKHSNLQPGDGEKYKSGWIEHYFNPMKDYFEEM